MLEGLRVGDVGEKVAEVTREMTIQMHDPSLPPVFGTPMMIYLMEVAGAEAMQTHLPPGHISVGVEVNIRHLAATLLGDTVRARATVLDVADNLVRFEVEAFDSRQMIGSGTHTRAAIDVERFKRGLEKQGLGKKE
ncbi:MAG: thioesterase family protein [Blastocatellia bacterium]|nr:thioesterase family protein [Blastocatellia bacterium]